MNESVSTLRCVLLSGALLFSADAVSEDAPPPVTPPGQTLGEQSLVHYIETDKPARPVTTGFVRHESPAAPRAPVPEARTLVTSVPVEPEPEPEPAAPARKVAPAEPAPPPPAAPPVAAVRPAGSGGVRARRPRLFHVLREPASEPAPEATL